MTHMHYIHVVLNDIVHVALKGKSENESSNITAHSAEEVLMQIV